MISIDSAYTRYLDLAANIGLVKVELHLPCDTVLFNSPTASIFHAQVNAGYAIMMPQVDLCAMSSDMLPNLHDYIVQIFFDFLTLKEAAARHKLIPKAVQHANPPRLVPFLVYQSNEQADQVRDILTSITLLRPRTLNETNPGLAVTWNHLCLHLLVDIDRIQNPCGRAGPEAARHAREELTLWCGTASARRAVLHSSQLFRLLSRYRVGDNKASVLGHVLFLAAIVMGVFFLLSRKTSSIAVNPPIELLGAIDWGVVGNTGLDTNDTVPYYVYPSIQGAQQGNASVTTFIRESGPMTFGGEEFEHCPQSARKVVLLFAQLLEEISLPERFEYTHLLKTIADFFIHTV